MKIAAFPKGGRAACLGDGEQGDPRRKEERIRTGYAGSHVMDLEDVRVRAPLRAPVLSCHYRNRAADRVAEHTRERCRRIET
jgi:hypothetical protein